MVHYSFVITYFRCSVPCAQVTHCHSQEVDWEYLTYHKWREGTPHSHGNLSVQCSIAEIHRSLPRKACTMDRIEKCRRCWWSSIPQPSVRTATSLCSLEQKRGKQVESLLRVQRRVWLRSDGGSSETDRRRASRRGTRSCPRDGRTVDQP